MKRLPILVAVLATTALAAIAWWLHEPENSGSKRRIVLVNFVDHPVLTTIQKETIAGIRTVFKESDVATESMSATGRIENIPDIGRTLRRQKPDLIVTISTPVSQGVFRELDERQPVIYTFVTDPSNLGDDLTRTNSTGLSDAVNYADNVKLIQELFGERAVIGFAYNPNEPNSVSGLKVLQTLIANSQMKLLQATVTSEAEVTPAIARLAANSDVIYVGGDNTTVGAIAEVLRAAADKKKVVIASDSGSIEAGAIAGVSVDYPAFGRATAAVVVRVLNGEDPRSIPRETVAGTSLIINAKAAAAADFTIPVAVRSRATRIIGEPGPTPRQD